MNEVTKAILEVSKLYRRRYGMTPRRMNRGLCEQFAEDVLELVKEVDDVSIEDNASEWFNHCWLEYKDRYYDAEAPYGVDEVADLPIFLRNRSILEAQDSWILK